MKNFILPMLGLFALFCSNCNPECVSLVGVDFNPKNCDEGSQIAITAQPNESLKGRQVYFRDQLAEVVSFDSQMGLIVTVPAGIKGEVEVRIEDPDCGDFTPINVGVAENGPLINQPGFVFPSPPEIIFPSTPPFYPPSIDNAWLSAQNPDYCLWLQSEKDVVVDPVTGASTTIVKKSIDPNASFELSTCLIGTVGFKTDPSSLFHFNTISGVVDTANNYIFIRIDRSKQLAIPANLRIENFEGRFLSADDETAKKYNVASLTLNCGGNSTPIDMAKDVKTQKNQMMLLKSLTSGRQLLIMHKKD